MDRRVGPSLDNTAPVPDPLYTSPPIYGTIRGENMGILQGLKNAWRSKKHYKAADLANANAVNAQLIAQQFASQAQAAQAESDKYAQSAAQWAQERDTQMQWANFYAGRNGYPTPPLEAVVASQPRAPRATSTKPARTQTTRPKAKPRPQLGRSVSTSTSVSRPFLYTDATGKQCINFDHSHKPGEVTTLDCNYRSNREFRKDW